MKTSTVNISFHTKLLAEIDRVAMAESRTRSELIREAARLYMDRKSRWRDIFRVSDAHRKKLRLRESDVEEAIQASRQSRREPRFRA